MSRHLHLSSLLDQIQTEVPGVRAAVLASRDGLAMASTLDGNEGSRVAAMAATVHAVGHRVSATAELGAVQETVIRSGSTTFVVYDAGATAVLAVLADGDCNLGFIHLESRRTAATLSELLTAKAPTPAPAETRFDTRPDADVATDTDVETAADSDAETGAEAEGVAAEGVAALTAETSPNGHGDHHHAPA